jgi:hypothetical protein
VGVVKVVGAANYKMMTNSPCYGWAVGEPFYLNWILTCIYGEYAG